MADRKLKDIFVVPPISVLEVKQEYWKKRRNEWQELKIQSELGRETNLLNLSPLMRKKQKATSVFDPVLCEIMYLWFSKKDDIVFDPFAGGSVRGIVASKCQRNYVGVDLRKEQVNHNVIQATEICSEYMPTWLVGSSAEVTIEKEYDFFFTCPPYYDLEKYSDDEKDLSSMSATNFDKTYAEIIKLSISKLSDNRFAAIVVGDVRDSNGIYLGLIQKTIKAFEDSGCRYYNDMILIQEPATAAMRAFNFMNSARKIAKAHQNVLVFVKGDPKIATDRMEKFEDKVTTESELNSDLFEEIINE
jgi:DNA modification methylase